MALTNDQLLDRIVELETAVRELETALSNLAPKRQINQVLALIKEQAIDIETDQEARLDAVIERVNEIQTAMNNLATKKNLNNAMGLKQQTLDSLETRVTDLESQIAILQEGD